MKNSYKSDFQNECKNKHYNKAIKIFEKIGQISTFIEPELRLDAAHAYFKLNDTLNARKNYELSLNIPDSKQTAVAYNQLGMLAIQKGDTALGLLHLKNALEQNNEFAVARFNYELIKTLYHPKTNITPPPKQNKNTSNLSVEASNEKEEELDPYKPKNISKEKALQLLEDLKNAEIKIVTYKKNSTKKIVKDW